MSIKSIWAWVIRPFTEESPMFVVEGTELEQGASLPEQNVVSLSPVNEEALPPMPAVVAPAPADSMPIRIGTLKAILTALGHDLDAVWDDAIALARKAL